MTGLIYGAYYVESSKWYIGQTMQGLRKRMRQHKSDSKRVDTKLYRAIKKYGWKSFQWVIIEDNITDIEEINRLEQYYISAFDSFKNGYNSTIGGGNFTVSEETKQKLSEVLTGRKLTKEHRRRMSEAKAKIPVLCVEKGTNSVLFEFESIKEAGRRTGIPHNNIINVLKGKYSQAGGYLWKQKE